MRKKANFEELFRPYNKANALADKSINVLAEASEYMQRDLEEFTKVVTEDATTVYSKVAEVTYQSINDYAGEEIAQDAVNIKSVCLRIIWDNRTA